MGHKPVPFYLRLPHTDGQADPEQQTDWKTIEHLLLLDSQQHGTSSSVSERGSRVRRGLEEWLLLGKARSGGAGNEGTKEERSRSVQSTSVTVLAFV